MERYRRDVRAARAVAKLLTVASFVLVASSCGGEPPDSGGNRLDPNTGSPEMQHERYDQEMVRVRALVEDPDAPPIDRSVNQGARRELLAMALRWDRATATVKSIDPPKDIAKDHAKLVRAMENLGKWNRRIAAAAPDRAQTRRLFKQARASADSTAFGEAVRAIEKRGYHVMTEPEASPLDGAGSPGG